MTITTVTPPANEILDHTDPALRQYLSLYDDETEFDAIVDGLVASMRDKAETYLRRRLITQTVRLTLDSFGGGGMGGIRLPIDPIQSVSAVKYIDGAGVEQTMDAADYRLITSDLPAALYPAYGQSWPVPRPDRDVVTIDMVVGYGDAATDVPPTIVQAIRIAVARTLNNREMIGEGEAEVPLGFHDMLNPYRLWI